MKSYEHVVDYRSKMELNHVRMRLSMPSYTLYIYAHILGGLGAFESLRASATESPESPVGVGYGEAHPAPALRDSVRSPVFGPFHDLSSRFCMAGHGAKGFWLRTDAFSSLHDILLNHHDISAEFLEAFPGFF